MPGNLNGVNAIYIDRFDYMWLGTGREGAFRSLDMGEREIFHLSVVRILGYINSWRPVMVISGSDIIRG